MLSTAFQAVLRFRPAPGRLVLPDVCCDIAYARGQQLLCGPVTRAHESQYVGEEVVLLKIRLTAARALLGVPLSELTDRIVPLEHVNPKLGRELDATCGRGRLEDLLTRAPRAAHGDARFAAAAAALAQGRAVARVADEIGLSERHLERLFYAHAGLAPKALARIVRLRGAVIAARSGLPLAQAAAAHRYADQAHFSREARELTGCAPRSLLPNVGSVQDVVAGEM
jgi:AraC-like DNA-binding protein